MRGSERQHLYLTISSEHLYPQVSNKIIRQENNWKGLTVCELSTIGKWTQDEVAAGDILYAVRIVDSYAAAREEVDDAFLEYVGWDHFLSLFVLFDGAFSLRGDLSSAGGFYVDTFVSFGVGFLSIGLFIGALPIGLAVSAASMAISLLFCAIRFPVLTSLGVTSLCGYSWSV